MDKLTCQLQSDDAGVRGENTARRENAARFQAEAKSGAATCYQNSIPDFVEAEMERLYGSLFSSLPQLAAAGKLSPKTCTYVARQGDEITAIFLYEHRNRQITVLNEGMKIGAEQLRLFSETMFAKHASAQIISLNAVETSDVAISLPHQRLEVPSELVLDLPASAENYLASLGKHIRYNIRRSLTRLPEAHPSFRMDFYDGASVRESHVRDIIDLNRLRMERVKRVYKRDEEDVQKVIDLCRARGLVAVMTIDGKVCGGSIGYLVGDSHAGCIVSHDPAYDKYSIGTLCIFLCIRECIARGCRQFNFMSGNNDYKSLLGGKPRRLEQVRIYRSRTHRMLNPDAVAVMHAKKLLHRASGRVQRELAAIAAMKSQGTLDARSRCLHFILVNLRAIKDRAAGLAKRN